MSVENFFPGHYPWQRILANSSLQIEELTVTENGTYSEDGKAYSPVTVNVPSTPTEYNVNTYFEGEVVTSIVYAAKYNGEFWVQDGATPIEKANAGSMLFIGVSDAANIDSIMYQLGEDFLFVPTSDQYTADNSITFVMPAGDMGVILSTVD